MSFAAKYKGRCAYDECSFNTIDPGDDVEYVDDELMHVGCAQRLRNNTKVPLCDDCGLYHRGEC